MQLEPHKVTGGYNEYTNRGQTTPMPIGKIAIIGGTSETRNSCLDLASDSLRRVTSLISGIIGNNKLRPNQVELPIINIRQTAPDQPNTAGYYSSEQGMINLVEDKIRPDDGSHQKVLTHEFFHFFSHNGFDLFERPSLESPLMTRNNHGLRRDFSVDVRPGNEGKITSDYFVSFNEAVTEMLAREAVPNFHQAYDDYIGLVNQVIEDAVKVGVGSSSASEKHVPWRAQQVKAYIYRCYFRGDLAGFSQLLQATYHEAGITETEFALMTKKEDLPKVFKKMTGPGKQPPPPPPETVKVRVANLTRNKTRHDYRTDVDWKDPRSDKGDPAELGQELHKFLTKNGVKANFNQSVLVDGKLYDIDNSGLRILSANESEPIYREALEVVSAGLARGLHPSVINDEVDKILFEKYKMSMLSSGFDKFYITKHRLIP